MLHQVSELIISFISSVKFINTCFAALLDIEPGVGDKMMSITNPVLVFTELRD